jgi:hypothetical protein
MVRALLAYCVAPFPAALFQSMIVALQPKTGGAAIYAHPVSMFMAICLIFYALGAILALPLVFALRRIWPGRRAYVRSGLFAGLMPAIAIVALAIPDGTMSVFGGLYILTFFGLGGYVAGALYWRLQVRDRVRDAEIKATFG